MLNGKIETVPGPTELAYSAAALIVELANAAVSVRGKFTWALSGGSTPRTLYQLLADPAAPFLRKMPWDKTHFFFTDERYVPPDHPDSNFRMANEAMLSKVLVPEAGVHRVRTENADVHLAAVDYETQLREVFDLPDGKVPHLDLTLLGLGSDGHTASVFPGSEVLNEGSRLVAAEWVAKMKSYRITLTIPVLNGARFVLFLVSGDSKAAVLRDVLESPADPSRLPAQAVKPVNGELLWLVDEAAAKELRKA
jgi:6-phosphogluconolactonase